MTNLNEIEKKVLKALVNESENYGHDFGITADVDLPEGITPKQFSGYMSQLVQKGYVWVSNDPGSGLPNQFVLEPKGLGVVS